MTLRDAAVAMAILVVAVACSLGQGTSPTAPPTVDLTIYTAASLKDVLAEIETAYEAAVPGTTLTVATDASSTLRTQIEEGAPADVFLSADPTHPQILVVAGLADGGAVDFAGNLLTIIVPTDDPRGTGSPVDLARPGIKIVAAGDAVPITKYAQQAIANLAAQPGYPADFASAYAANVVSKEENVTAVVAKIELGEGDAAIVYVTDAMTARGTKTIEIPAAANVPATYAGVVVGASTRPTEAHAFLDWLAGAEGSAILARFGFLAPS